MQKTQPFHQASRPLHPLFEGNAALYAAAAPQMRSKLCAHGDRVISHGDAAANLWLVMSGWVKLSRQTPDGKETIVGLCTQGDIFGEAVLFANASYPYTAEVVGDGGELAAIPAALVREQVAVNRALSARIITMLSDRSSQAQLKLEQMSTMSAAQRLGCFLLRLCHAQKDGSKTIQIPVEKNVLAAYLGMKPETLSRSQQQLGPLGISVAGDKITVADIARLRGFVCGSCSESGSCDIEDSLE